MGKYATVFPHEHVSGEVSAAFSEVRKQAFSTEAPFARALFCNSLGRPRHPSTTTQKLNVDPSYVVLHVVGLRLIMRTLTHLSYGEASPWWCIYMEKLTPTMDYICCFK